MHMALRARSQPLGPLHPSFDLLQMVKDSLRTSLPQDAHVRVSGRLGVSLTRVPDGKNVLVSDFQSREELIEVKVQESGIIVAVLSAHAAGTAPPSDPSPDPLRSGRRGLTSCVVSLSRRWCAAASSRCTAAWFRPPTAAW